ncbi:hypothetical protein ABIB75_004629 [Bradyrhizobium sp. GM2.2]
MMATLSTPVMAGLDPAIHVEPRESKSWMPGSSPGMTIVDVATPSVTNSFPSCP